MRNNKKLKKEKLNKKNKEIGKEIKIDNKDLKTLPKNVEITAITENITKQTHENEIFFPNLIANVFRQEFSMQKLAHRKKLAAFYLFVSSTLCFNNNE